MAWLKEVDPFNRLYARQSSARLDAEFVRDDALQISGLLVPTVGGPSVNPYQPADYYKELNFPKRTYTPGVSCQCQLEVVKCVKELDRQFEEVVDDPEVATRISLYELAFPMQTSVPELTDFSGEPQHVRDLYGTRGGDGTFASNCLLARRLAERGVRFIQLYHRGWDHHGGVKAGTKTTAGLVDRASAALLLDLKQRGMLDETLVIWGGEFGRTPMAQGDGRDHHLKGFSIWMAGGGIRGGLTYGATDEFGYNATENPVDVHDFHATLLRLFGLDHKRLTYRFQGRDFRLTDVKGNVVNSILA